MTTIQIELSDELAQHAEAAGLLTPEAMERILREQLRQQAGSSLHDRWGRMSPDEKLSPAIEEMINEAVQAARADQRRLT